MEILGIPDTQMSLILLTLFFEGVIAVMVFNTSVLAVHSYDFLLGSLLEQSLQSIFNLLWLASS